MRIRVSRRDFVLATLLVVAVLTSPPPLLEYQPGTRSDKTEPPPAVASMRADATTEGGGDLTFAASPLCKRLLESPNEERLWHDTRPLLQQFSLPNKQFRGGPEGIHLRSDPRLKQWVNESLDFFTFNNLQKSQMHPPNAESLRAIMKILNLRIMSTRSDGNAAATATATAPPLRIMTFGGSVTAGHGCPGTIFPDLVLSSRANIPFKDCAWSSRLEDFLNAMFGDGAVEVTNMASGGASSDVSTLVIDYRQWPAGYPKEGPDMILWAHGINDAVALPHDARSSETLLEYYLNPFVQATHNLQCHRQHLPLLVVVDELLGEPTSREFLQMGDQLLLSNTLYRTVTWYELWGVSYANVMRPHMRRHYKNGTTIFPLLGSTLTRHPGMMYHMGVSWVVLFGILTSMQQSCQSNADLVDNIGPLPRPLLETAEAPLSYRDIPLLSESLQLEGLKEEWDRRANRTNAACQEYDPKQPVCEYYWTVNTMTNTKSKEDVVARLKPILISSEGWEATGFPVRQPRAGWSAMKAGAWFAITLPITNTAQVKFMTIVAMKSYSDSWVNSTVQVNITVHQSGSENELLPAPPESVVHSIGGYHTLKTSVLIPRKFEIPTTRADGHIQANFTLTDGNNAKITGMAFCSR